ncbi:hypothetical protein NL676_012798 [Syzygium grande]|nr:hypothetical protein NL676_012798 [Syzygium grande]
MNVHQGSKTRLPEAIPDSDDNAIVDNVRSARCVGTPEIQPVEMQSWNDLLWKGQTACVLKNLINKSNREEMVGEAIYSCGNVCSEGSTRACSLYVVTLSLPVESLDKPTQSYSRDQRKLRVSLLNKTSTGRKLTQISSKRLPSVHLNETWLGDNAKDSQVGGKSLIGLNSLARGHTKSHSPLTGSHISVRSTSQLGKVHVKFTTACFKEDIDIFVSGNIRLN